jgi:hypothetical protein
VSSVAVRSSRASVSVCRGVCEVCSLSVVGVVSRLVHTVYWCALFGTLQWHKVASLPPSLPPSFLPFPLPCYSYNISGLVGEGNRWEHNPPLSLHPHLSPFPLAPSPPPSITSLRPPGNREKRPPSPWHPASVFHSPARRGIHHSIHTQHQQLRWL